jgi:predicted ATP-dependent endonuclease of OLD family
LARPLQNWELKAMYLSEFISLNYRSCKNIHIKLDNDYPNVFIGINDCGKSSVLQAVGLLLNAKIKFFFANEDKKKNDISNTPLSEQEMTDFLHSCGLPSFQYKSQQTIFIGKFIVESTDINPANEEGLSNHLKWVIGNSDGKTLWLARVFDGEKQTSSSYLLTPDKKDEPLSLYKQSATNLNKAKKDHNVTKDEVENENKVGRFKNIELVSAIYKKYTLDSIWAEYAVDKNFWVEYRYLNWDFTLEELTQFANDIVSQNISAQIDVASKFAKRQAAKAQSIINQELAKLASVLKADLQNIKAIQANVNFQITSLMTDIMVDKENSDGAVHLDSQGDGVKRQLWFALLKWKAFRDVQNGITDTKFIWCFDEPETHLYPKAQREFFEIIKTVSQTNVQSLISTHSTVFIDRAKLKNINKVDLANGYTVFSKCDDVDDIYNSLQIKNSDFLFYDNFLVVEGDTEQALIPFLFELHYGKPLSTNNVQVINLGGKTKRQENQKILRNILGSFRKETSGRIVYIFDNDALAEFTNAEIQGMNCVFVGKQDIEDSIESSVWLSVITEQTNGQLPITIEEIEQIKSNLPAVSSNQKLQSNQKFYEQLKRLVNRKANDANLLEFQHILPSKGLDSGKLLTKHINSIEQISPQIKFAFERLESS